MGSILQWHVKPFGGQNFFRGSKLAHWSLHIRMQFLGVSSRLCALVVFVLKL
jgi:hypothetical protein